MVQEVKLQPFHITFNLTFLYFNSITATFDVIILLHARDVASPVKTSSRVSSL